MKTLVNLSLFSMLLLASSGCCCHRNWYGNSGACGPCGQQGSFYAPAGGGCSSGQCAPAMGMPSSTYTVPQGAYMQGGAPMTAMPMTNPGYTTALLPSDPLPTY
jgi:hypothetical protein